MEAIAKSDFLLVNNKQQQFCYLWLVLIEIEALVDNWEAIVQHWWAADILMH